MSEGRITIALVDDSEDVRALVRSRLTLSRRFEVVGEAGTGREALAVATSLQPEMLLLDVSMPDMDGLDALEQLRAVAPDTCVVMFSGFEEHGLADRARALGAADFVEKSVPIEELVTRLVAAAAPDAPTPVDADTGPVVAPQAEPVLTEHLERFRAAFEEAAIGMGTLTLTGRIVRANDALGAIASRHDSLVGASYADLVNGNERQSVERVIAEVASGRRDTSSVEHSVDGHRVISTLAVIRDSRRRPLYLFLQAQDVTERRVAEEELRRSEEQFRLLVEGVGDYAIFMLDTDGHIASWNLGAERAKGYTTEEVLGRHFSIFYPPEAVASGHPQHELEVATAEGRYEEEGWRVRKDGTTFWANVVITALRDQQGHLLGFSKVTRDVSERRRLLEELREEAAKRTELLAVTAHELRNPVSLVNGFASTLRAHWDDLTDPERLEMVDAIARGGGRLTRLVDDIFTASRLESGGIDFQPAAIELDVLVREVVRDIGEGAITVDAEPVAVTADRVRVQQMLGNYLTNALRYGAAPITVTVAVEGGAAQVVVRDRGPGVAEGLLPGLFGKFTRTRSQDGTGLGLFIVRELARAQGGDAWYRPGADGGAEFGLTLPLAT